MGYDADQKSSSSCGVVAVVLMLVVLFAGGLCVVALAALFFMRVQTRQTEMVAQREQAIAQEMQARIEMEQVRLQAEQEIDELLNEAQQAIPELPRPAGLEARAPIDIRVDEEGNVYLSGNRVDREALVAQLRRRQSDSALPLQVQLQVVGDASWEAATTVLAACRAARIHEIRVALN